MALPFSVGGGHNIAQGAFGGNPRIKNWPLFTKACCAEPVKM